MQSAIFGNLSSNSANDVAANLGHFSILAFVFYSTDSAVQAGIFAVIASLSFYGWIYNYRRGRAIADIAPSAISSAAQGYVELNGRCSVQADSVVISPVSGTRCVWYRFWMYERSDDDWRLVNEGSSPYTVQIDDGSGTCQVDLDGAEVIGGSRRVQQDREYKNVELLLFGGADLYVLGEFSTVGGANSTLSLKEDVNALLTSWKQDKTGLLMRFDLDKDGEIDTREWELARREAVREVQMQHREIRASDGVHVMRAPRDKKLFMVSTLAPQKLRNRFMVWTAVHMAIVLLAFSFALTFWHRHLQLAT